MDDMTFAERIISLREAAQMTQSGFARFLGVDRVTVWRWENGQTLPAAYVVDLIEYKLRNQGYIK